MLSQCPKRPLPVPSYTGTARHTGMAQWEVPASPLPQRNGSMFFLLSLFAGATHSGKCRRLPSPFFWTRKRLVFISFLAVMVPSACGTWEQMIRRAHIGTILLPKSINPHWNFFGNQAVKVPAETNLSSLSPGKWNWMRSPFSARMERKPVFFGQMI